MANYFSNSPASASSSVLGAPKSPEQSLHEKILGAIEMGHWVVSLPWGANPRKKDGRESQHLLMSQKGPIGYGQYGVFGSIRAEGFLVWNFQTVEDGKVDPASGGWQYPTPHRRGEDGDTPIPGADISGMHRLMLENWRAEHLALANEYRELGEEAEAKKVEAEAMGFTLADVFGKQLTFSLPMEVGQLRALKAQGLAAAGAGRKPEKAVMVFNLILAVDFTYSEDGEYGIKVVEVLETCAPLLTIPNGSRQILDQSKVLAALNARGNNNNTSKEEKLRQLAEKRGVLLSKQGVNAKKKEARKKLAKVAKAMGVDSQKLQEYIKQRAGGMGLVWGVENLQFSKEEIEAWMASGEQTAPDPAPPEKSVKGGLLPGNGNDDLPEAEDVDCPV
jgi:hypothetical protein